MKVEGCVMGRVGNLRGWMGKGKRKKRLNVWGMVGGGLKKGRVLGYGGEVGEEKGKVVYIDREERG